MALFEKQDGTFVRGENDIINKRELIELLGVSRATIQRMMKNGLPYTRFVNYVAFDYSEVKHWLEENNYAPPELMSKWNKQIKEARNNGD